MSVSVQTYLNSICPNVPLLDENSRMEIPDDLYSRLHSTVFYNQFQVQLSKSYLNISRPPLKATNVLKESTTYVSLPLHVMYKLKELMKLKARFDEGNMQIGANVNPFVTDPFKFVELNPGCLSIIMNLDDGAATVLGSLQDSSSTSLTNGNIKRLTTNFSKFLRMDWTSLTANKSTNFHPLNANSVPFPVIIDKIVKIHDSPQSIHGKLLVATHVNVLSIMPLTSLQGAPGKLNNEEIIRIKFKKLITSVSSKGSWAILGFRTGEIVIIDVINLEYLTYDTKLSLAITCIKPMFNHIWIGSACGHVMIINPLGTIHTEDHTISSKPIVDQFVTYMKPFNLSPFQTQQPSIGGSKAAPRNQDLIRGNEFLVGHFKITQKPITTMACTKGVDYKATGASESTSVLHQPFVQAHQQPLIVAIGSADGFVRFFDLASEKFLTDIISNYLNDGILHVEFSPDNRFISVVGKGDLIEVFKLVYYNVALLLGKQFGKDGHQSVHLAATPLNTSSSFILSSSMNTTKTRSRSGTLGSMGSTENNIHEGIEDDRFQECPPVIKEIEIVTRVKGHTNTVSKTYWELTKLIPQTYRLISCGQDGRVQFWDFDYKSINKLKKKFERLPKHHHHNHHKGTQASTMVTHTNSTKSHTSTTNSQFLQSHLQVPSGTNGSLFDSRLKQLVKSHQRRFSHGEDLNLLSLASSSSLNNVGIQPETKNDNNMEMIIGFYRSLFEMRNRKALTGTASTTVNDHQPNGAKKVAHSIIHPIVFDKFVPSINNAICSLDLSLLIGDAKIDNCYVDDEKIYCMCKNGDIFHFTLTEEASPF